MGKDKKREPISAAALEDVKCSIDILVNVCKRHNLAIGGFVFGVNPVMLYNFGNTKEAKDIEFYEKLVRLANARRTAGAVVDLTPSKPS